MATALDQRPRAGAAPGPPPPPRMPRRSRWVASWRVALRMARRDVRRHRGRSALVIVMVMLPVALLVAAICWGATGQISGRDRIPMLMGTGQALVQAPQGTRIAQLPDGDSSMTTQGKEQSARSVPGFVAGTDNTTAMQRLLGGTLVPVTQADSRLVAGDRRTLVQGLVIDGRTADVGDKAQLESGRWGSTSAEIVVTPAGHAKGLPESGTVTLSAGGERHQVTVVGTGTALSAFGGMPDYVVPRLFSDDQMYGESWILQRDTPVSWAEVRRLNEYGILVASRAVLLDPPPTDKLDASLQGSQDFQAQQARELALIGGALLFLVTVLLVAPAFAVSASRQRRTLALAACNGAEPRQLRRSVLAQGVVLGIGGAVVGGLGGALGLGAAIEVWQATHPATTIGNLDVPIVPVLIVVGIAILSVLTAAMLPALRLGRLDIIGVMRGQSVSPRPSRVLPVIGALLFAAGAAYMLFAVRTGSSPWAGVGSSVALVGGMLLLVPILLVAIGRLAARLPIAARMAARDAARHRTRSAPTVAAILAGVVALTVFAIGLASDTEHQRRDYTPQALAGEGFVQYGAGDRETAEVVRTTLAGDGAGLVSVPFGTVASDSSTPTQQGTETALPAVVVVAPGCPVRQTLSPPPPGGTPPCDTVGTVGYGPSLSIYVIPADELVRRMVLTSPQAEAVRRGAMVTAKAGLAPSGTATVLSGTVTIRTDNGEPTDTSGLRSSTIPVVTVPAGAQRDGRFLDGSGAAVTPETAARLGWPVQAGGYLLHDPDGPISAEVADRITGALSEQAYAYVERGFVRDDATIMLVMFTIAIVLLLIVTLISTALALSEQQADLGTFAAVGATRGTRRRFAAAQAMVVGFLGAVLGIVVGLVPGIAVTYPLTATSYDQVTQSEVVHDPIIVIPWLPLLGVVVGVPLLAGLLAAAAIRRAPQLTRRAE